MAASFSKNIDKTFIPQATDHLKEPALKYAGTDFPVIPAHLAIGEALRLIRTKGLGERIIYFYAVDSEEKLVGIVPTRWLLTSMPNIRTGNRFKRFVCRTYNGNHRFVHPDAALRHTRRFKNRGWSDYARADRRCNFTFLF